MNETRMNKWRALAVAMVMAVSALAAEDSFDATSLIAPKGAEQRNPTTEISVGFGDVSHISPWQVKRRFPRTGGGERSGKLVTLRDALLALNGFIAKDEEMPEHAFQFAADGSVDSVCDIHFAKPRADGSSPVVVLTDVAGGHKTVTAVAADLLDRPVRDFAKIEFLLAAKPQAQGAAAKGAAVPAEAHGGPRKSGTTKTVTLPGGAKMELIWCEPGMFMMGSPVTEVGRFEDELLHPVTISKGFWLGKYEVTQAQWESVMGTHGSKFKGPSNPVDSISWEDCQSFVRKVNATLGGAARLPTEAEWEYACRAGSQNPVSGSGHLNDMAWYDKNSDNRTHEVGQNQPNAWGFYDMHGNVLEWCSDWFGKHDNQAIVDPKGPPVGSFRVLRGGCWFFYERDCRSAYRLKRAPVIRNCIYGFRLACSDKLR